MTDDRFHISIDPANDRDKGILSYFKDGRLVSQHNLNNELPKVDKTTWLTKLVLFFIRKRTTVEHFYTVQYKIYRGRKYIIASWFHPPVSYNCRCTLF